MPTEFETHRMEALRIAEISGVDFPAHLVDGWLVNKSRLPSKEATVPIDKDALDPEIAAAITELESQVTKALEAQTTAEAALAEATKVVPPEPTEDDVLKSLPAAFRERVEKAERDAAQAIADAQAERDVRLTNEFVAKARDLDRLPGVDAGEFGPVMKALAEADPENAAKAFLVLKAANAAMAESGAFEAAGTSGDSTSDGTAASELETVAKSLMAADPELSMASATEKAAMSRPDLYAQHIAESRKAG